MNEPADRQKCLVMLAQLHAGGCAVHHRTASCMMAHQHTAKRLMDGNTHRCCTGNRQTLKTDGHRQRRDTARCCCRAKTAKDTTHQGACIALKLLSQHTKKPPQSTLDVDTMYQCLEHSSCMVTHRTAACRAQPLHGIASAQEKAVKAHAASFAVKASHMLCTR
jgi:hypothetical protein